MSDALGQNGPDAGQIAGHEGKAPAVRLRGLSLSLGGNRILSDIDLDLMPGQVLALLGPSGSGKTTILRLVAGLMAPDAGAIEIGGRVMADAAQGVFVPSEQRGLGMVFQDYALWPHMSVFQNVAFPLEMQRVAKADRKHRVMAALERVGLAGLADRRPSALSGGQQQRVAIARAIVAEPKLVLFDEPLSNLDRELRETMVDEIAGLVADLGLTALYVTHDHSEAFSLAHHVAVMRAGEVEQIAPPEELVAHPVSDGVARFLRLGAILPVEARSDGWYLTGGERLAPRDACPTPAVQVLIPAAAVTPVAPGQSDQGDLGARVVSTLFRGDGYVTRLTLAGGHDLHLTLPSRSQTGDLLDLRLTPENLRWFSDSSSKKDKT